MQGEANFIAYNICIIIIQSVTYLSYVDVCSRANHINLHIPLPLLSQPSKELCILSRIEHGVNEIIGDRLAISVLSTISTLLTNPPFPTSPSTSLSQNNFSTLSGDNAVFSTRMITLTPAGVDVFGSIADIGIQGKLPSRATLCVIGSSLKILSNLNLFRDAGKASFGASLPFTWARISMGTTPVSSSICERILAGYNRVRRASMVSRNLPAF